MGARHESTESRIADGKATQARMISMLHAWCAKNGIAGLVGIKVSQSLEQRSTGKKSSGLKRRF